MIDKFAVMMQYHNEALSIGTNTWIEQIKNAMSMPEPEEGEENTLMDYALHFLSFYWKGIMAIIPPESYCGGWGTFVVSLIFVGLQTAIVGDLAGMFGCVVGL